MFPEAKKGLWTQNNSFGSLKMLKKLIFGPQKMEKIHFLQNLDLPDLAKHGWGFPQCPTSIPNKLFSWLILYIKTRSNSIPRIWVLCVNVTYIQ